MEFSRTTPGRHPLAILLVALALSIGWGVRGNWGHEYGAMLPGALAAIAAVIVSGRSDWQRRIAYFAFFGALGWSFGGSISYMQVIGYTHSAHEQSVVYGFACLFLIGFLWAAPGGAGTAFGIFLDRERLTELFWPVLAVFAAWAVQDAWMGSYIGELRAQAAEGVLSKADVAAKTAWMNWNDTDWMGVLVAAGALAVQAVLRRRCCWGTSLGLLMCTGWWLGFTVLTLGLGLRMTPPRGDNWSGMLGLVIAMFGFFAWRREWGITWTALVVGLFGGIGFSGATAIKMVLMYPPFQEHVFGETFSSNWHSVLEQTFGFISGLGVALAVAYWNARGPRQPDESSVRRWTECVAVFFVMVPFTYVNIVKNLEAVWLKNGTVAETLWGYSSLMWFNLGYLALALAVALPLVAWYRGRELTVLPEGRLGKGQLFFIILLWWIVVGNLSRTVPFGEQRLITEGVIHVNACLCTLLAILLPTRRWIAGEIAPTEPIALLQRTLVAAVLATIIIVGGEYVLTRSTWGDEPVGGHAEHIRFGPNAKLDKK